MDPKERICLNVRSDLPLVQIFMCQGNNLYYAKRLPQIYRGFDSNHGAPGKLSWCQFLLFNQALY